MRAARVPRFQAIGTGRNHALVGYDGWSAHFEEIEDDEHDDDDFNFQPGELDEDRDTEQL